MINCQILPRFPDHKRHRQGGENGGSLHNNYNEVPDAKAGEGIQQEDLEIMHNQMMIIQGGSG